MKPNEERIRQQWRAVGIASMATTSLLVSILLGWGLGNLAEGRFPHNGLWELLGLLLGVVAGFVEMFQLIQRAYYESKPKDE